uniref:Laminin N-terminal domain-containing protein n=1 Tax=Meloidogyne hapla TaxID=6305 RepID=A0A1I8BE04_MELHA
MFLAKWRQPKLCLLCLAAIFFSLLQIVLTNELVQIYPTTNNELISNIGGYSDNWQSPQFSEFSSGKDEKGLFPSIFNLATHAEIRASSTCGQHGPDYYCKLVEHVFLRQPQCDICDANNHHKNHPIDYAIDGTKRWWQSPTLSNGLNYERVNITLDLRQAILY